MALIDDEGNCILEPGVFQVFIGGNQPDERSAKLTDADIQKGFFQVKGKALELEY